MSDLISRKEALKNYQSICKGVACTDCQMRYDDGECKLERFLRDAPTIEAEPTKHGRWEKDGARMMFGNVPVKCSQCGFKTLQDALHKMDYHYCPNCGAKMDEVEE